VKRQVEGKGGRVRLGASTGAIAHLLPQALELLAQHHPGIDVQIAVLTSQEMLIRLSSGTLDVGLVALPQPTALGLTIKPWRRDPVRAFMPAGWNSPARVTPQWLAARPLILNDASTRFSRLTAEWFATAGEHPVARIQLNFTDAIRSLVAAGYGAALLPQEAVAAVPDPRVTMRPLRPPLWRELGIAHRAKDVDRPTHHVLDALWSLRSR
jgi:DNA-binding transcriptional LysR family regulator